MANLIIGGDSGDVSNYGTAVEDTSQDLSLRKMVGKIHFRILDGTELYYFVQFVGEGLAGGRFISGRLLKLTNLETIVQYLERRIYNEEDRNSLNYTMFMAQKKNGDILM